MPVRYNVIVDLFSEFMIMVVVEYEGVHRKWIIYLQPHWNISMLMPWNI